MKTTKRIISIVAAIAVMLFMTVGTLAYFATYATVESSEKITLIPKTGFTEGEDSKVKNVVMTNEGDTDVCVRVKLSWATYDEEGNPLEREVIVTPGSGWVRTDNGSVGGYAVYEYDTVLEKDDATTELKVETHKKVTGEESEELDPTTELEEYEVSVIWEYTQAMYGEDGTISPYAWTNGTTIYAPAAIEEVNN